MIGHDCPAGRVMQRDVVIGDDTLSEIERAMAPQSLGRKEGRREKEKIERFQASSTMLNNSPSGMWLNEICGDTGGVSFRIIVISEEEDDGGESSRMYSGKFLTREMSRIFQAGTVDDVCR
ncbi:uncharacterized protein LOC126853015 [Cataglyphis hispanica]|uniref:uncharacterized protein LOC126853015 n=1 Tax=Cataglyphis hispanica TaxID=1086592 RepID=UPI00218032D1|nr:uncharacterized protein LOC126853015 [Cataglyphis hispanica]